MHLVDEMGPGTEPTARSRMLPMIQTFHDILTVPQRIHNLRGAAVRNSTQAEGCTKANKKEPQRMSMQQRLQTKMTSTMAMDETMKKRNVIAVIGRMSELTGVSWSQDQIHQCCWKDEKDQITSCESSPKVPCLPIPTTPLDRIILFKPAMENPLLAPDLGFAALCGSMTRYDGSAKS